MMTIELKAKINKMKKYIKTSKQLLSCLFGWMGV